MLVVLIAALLHAVWNFLVKGGDDKYLGMAAVVLGHAPFALAALLVFDFPHYDSLLYVIIGAFLHTGYQLFLLHSYRLGDLSFVYPVSRGVAPLMVALASILFLGVSFTRAEAYALFMIAAGIMSFALVRPSSSSGGGRCLFLALLTGGFIASYSIVDGTGARLAGNAVGFYGCLSTLNALIFALVMAVRKPGLIKRLVFNEWHLALKGGGASFAAYAMVIWAFTRSPIALVTALRDTSIVMAFLLGVIFLKERIDPRKVIATLLTVAGVVMLRLHF